MVTCDIPRIETERLILRPMRMEDWPAYETMLGSSRSVHMGGPFDTIGAWGMFCNDAAQWCLLRHGALMIDVKSIGVCVGQVGINYGPLFPEHELGWLLYPDAEGKGFAREAAIAMRKWAFDVRGLTTLVSYIDPDNVRSIRLAERLGATLDRDARGYHSGDLVYRHPK
ncbi:GNAT family N-acetyltransferase [Thalassospira xiamenensis]|uniref:GNAT family N-acetyltransferase n=2 Tax=Thalassospiraceae TaxID=2844866 RepID=UPI0008DE2731|nr:MULTISPECIES: GNAT family N-acetyltransferase [Thalassospira]MAB35478.1 N-acetyltransferase [Thalassospira sp.]MDM7978345.1 GNAT family N-acetyltransferase [Thalassospira xiamenensis]HBS21928.1 N-acetyltransferase [Thalassospira sp.]